mgnify:CR=1 FL=1
MEFVWSDKEFVLNKQNTSRHDDFLYVYSDDILRAFQDRFYVVARELSIEILEDTGHAFICARLDYSVRFGEDEEFLSEYVILTDGEKLLFEDS